MAGSENEERPEARGKQVPPLRWCGSDGLVCNDLRLFGWRPGSQMTGVLITTRPLGPRLDFLNPPVDAKFTNFAVNLSQAVDRDQRGGGGRLLPEPSVRRKSSAFLAGVPGMFGTDHGVDLNSQKVHLRVTNSTSERNQPILATEGVPRSLQSAVMGRSFQQCDLEGTTEELFRKPDETVRRLECRNNVQWARVKRRVAGHQPRNDDPGRKACVNEVVLSDSKQVTLPRRVKGGAVRTDGSGDWGMCGENHTKNSAGGENELARAPITHIKARFLAGEKDRESGTDTAQVRIYRPRPSLQRAGPRGQTVVLAGQAEFSPGKTGRKLPYTRPGEKTVYAAGRNQRSGRRAAVDLTTASDLPKVFYFTLYPM
ncbi:hypothetical protein Bbelb_414400 [Branchiostoma belcheri]|nr:hypothetical protein Bbelb_414400 [Branchiostoma belcheri]